jgi:membrane protease YdiL (CAAX protease family)
MTTITIWIKKHSLLTFFILAYAISWTIEIPLVLRARGVIQVHIPFLLHYLSAFGPMSAALIVTGLTSGSRGLKALWSRMIKWKVHPGWWLIAFTPLVLYLVVAVALWLTQGIPMGMINTGRFLYYVSLMGNVGFLGALGMAALPVWILTFGIGEETGWRGFALPRLQKGRSALLATIILWIFWAFWHLPLFFYLYNVSILPGFLFGLLAGAITFTWLYNSTQGSILMVAIWHGAFNFTTACVDCKTALPTQLISILVMVWAVIVVLHFKPAKLARGVKQVIQNVYS